MSQSRTTDDKQLRNTSLSYKLDQGAIRFFTPPQGKPHYYKGKGEDLGQNIGTFVTFWFILSSLSPHSFKWAAIYPKTFAAVALSCSFGMFIGRWLGSSVGEYLDCSFHRENIDSPSIAKPSR